MKEANHDPWQILVFLQMWLTWTQSLSGGKIEKHIFLLELSTGGREDKMNFIYMISNVLQGMMIITTEKIQDIQNT